MFHLILIFAVKTQFNTSVDIKQFGTYNTVTECNDSAYRIANTLKKIDSDIKVEYYCEK